MTTLSVRNPRTGRNDYEIEAGSRTTVSAISSGLRAHQVVWLQSGAEKRAMRLMDLAIALERHIDAIASALEADTGRRRIARMEVEGVVASIKTWTGHSAGSGNDVWTQGFSNPNLKHRSQLVPYSLVGVISPWNFPLVLSMIDTIPALLAGCSVLIKPSEITPRFVAPLEVAIEEAGLSGVLGFVTGAGDTGIALVDCVDAICFTGSVSTGRKVGIQAAGRLIPAFLELGGKDPMIVLGSADIERATDAALRGSVLSTGQACQSIERIYVADAIHDAFLQRLTQKANAVRLNANDISTGELGPIIFDKQAAILEEHIEDARERGAAVLTGGKIENIGGGLWLRPTIIAGVTHEMRVMKDESFGPILPVMPFSSIEQAIALANDSEFGLSAAVFSGSLEESEAVGRELEAGAVSLNDAALTSLFHEAEKTSFKSSGLGGSRMGRASLERFMRRKALIANTGAPSPITAFSEDPS
jgi:succinate-semialdehyde dehydrogenase / glutarate-semialdehyde dehydrogenase